MAVNATAVWRVRPSGSNTNGGGYDPGISGAGTDYSQQNAAQASGTNGATTGTTTFTDATANAFTSAMVGNAMYITGTGQTTGWYFVTGFTSSSVVTLDRSPGTGTGATWNLGGGWADFWTNGATPVNANTIYVLGSGVPNPSAYTYDYTISSAKTITSAVTNFITVANDPNTPGYKSDPDTTGGMPTVRMNFSSGSGSAAIIDVNNAFGYKGIWFVGSTNCAAGDNLLQNTEFLFGCVLDQFGIDINLVLMNKSIDFLWLAGNEFFSSVAASGGVNHAINFGSGSHFSSIIGNNIHDCVGDGLSLGGASTFSINSNTIAKNGGSGINAGSIARLSTVINNTIDGNANHGIVFGTATTGANTQVLNNIISNHSTAGAYGIKGASGTPQNGSCFIDYNVYYNNTSDLNNLNYGPHDTHGGSNPYVGQSTENYTLA